MTSDEGKTPVAHEVYEASFLTQSEFVVESGQWKRVVCEAWQRSAVPEHLGVQQYLVEMFERSVIATDMFQKLAEFNYYTYALHDECNDLSCIQEVADASLQYVAFFPGRSAYRHEPRSLRYTADIGKSLYRDLGEETRQRIFLEMAHHFATVVMILRSIRSFQ